MELQIPWNMGEPPRLSVNTYLLLFYDKFICTGKWRYGNYGEPQQDVLAWRCDCCGRFATPKAWCEISKV